MTECIITREAVAVLGAKLESHVAIGTLRRGLALFRGGALRHVWQDNFSIVHGIVHDREDFKLHVDLDFFSASGCSCGADKYCAHMAAVYSSLYAEHDRPELWLEQVERDQAAASARIAAADAAAGAADAPAGAVPGAAYAAGATDAQSAGVQASGGTASGGHSGSGSGPGRQRNGSLNAGGAAADALTVTGIVGVYNAASPGDWRAMLDKELHYLHRRHNDKFKIDIFYMNAYRKLCSLSDEWDTAAGARFRLYCALFVLERAGRYFCSTRHEYPSGYYHRVTADLHDFFYGKLRDGAQEIDARELARHYPLFGDALIALLAEADEPAAADSPFDWLLIRRYLWTHLLCDEAWIERELARLGANAPGGGAGTDAHTGAASEAVGARAAAAAAHLHWLLGRDGDAMRLLAAAHTPPVPTIVHFLEAHYRARVWSRLGAWLEFALPYLRRASGEQFNRALMYWREYARHTGSGDSLRSALEALLPRSYAQYTDHLLESGQYELWSRFHLLNGISPVKIDHGQMSRIEAQGGALAAPLYHQAIERLMASRNRTAYRDCVKLLKRLRDLYAAAGEQVRFQHYMSEIVAKHQRLHAFQEELRKGKLAP